MAAPGTTWLQPARHQDSGIFVDYLTWLAQTGVRDAPPGAFEFEFLGPDFDWGNRARLAVRTIGGVRRVVGVGIVTERFTTSGLVSRIEYGAADAEAESALIEWGISVARARSARVVDIWRGRGRAGGVEAHGFTVIRPFWRMDLPPQTPAVAGTPVAGYQLFARIQDVISQAEWVRAYNRSFVDHWQHAVLQQSQWDRKTASRRHLAEATLIAFDRRGEAGALVVCSIDHELANRPGERRTGPIGFVDVVGTAPEHRRRGLARWLLGEALVRLRAAGARTISLYVDGASANRAYELYRQSGFSVAFEYEVWERSLA